MLPRNSTEEHMSKQEFLYELQKETLNKQRSYLCNHLEPERLFPYLQSKNCLSLDDCEQIRSMNTTKSRVNKLVDILIKCGPDCLVRLIKAIKRSAKTQIFVADKIYKDYQERIDDEENKKRLEEITGIRNTERTSETEFRRSAIRNNVPQTANTPPPPYTDSLSTMTSSSIMISGRPQQPPYVGGSTFPGQNPSLTSDRPPLLRPYSTRTPVTGEWPSNSSSYLTSHFMQRVENFDSGDYPREAGETPPPYVDDQVEKLSLYNQENSTAQESYGDVFRATQLTPEHRRHLPYQHRLPEEHDSSITEIKRVCDVESTVSGPVMEENDKGSTSCTDHNGALDSRVSGSSSYTLLLPPDDESFEVSGDVSHSLYMSS